MASKRHHEALAHKAFANEARHRAKARNTPEKEKNGLFYYLEKNS